MKKTTLTEDSHRDFQTFFDEETFAPNQIAISETAALENNPKLEITSFLDKFLTAVKWIFLYLPGVAAIHFTMIGFGLLFFYDVSFVEVLPRMLVVPSIATFMIMFGIGKMSDLKYLKVVLGIFLTSSLMAILYGLSVVFIPGDFFGFFAKITFPLPILAGYLIKRNIDAEKKGD